MKSLQAHERTFREWQDSPDFAEYSHHLIPACRCALLLCINQPGKVGRLWGMGCMNHFRSVDHFILAVFSDSVKNSAFFLSVTNFCHWSSVSYCDTRSVIIRKHLFLCRQLVIYTKSFWRKVPLKNSKLRKKKVRGFVVYVKSSALINHTLTVVLKSLPVGKPLFETTQCFNVSTAPLLLFSAVSAILKEVK